MAQQRHPTPGVPYPLRDRAPPGHETHQRHEANGTQDRHRDRVHHAADPPEPSAVMMSGPMNARAMRHLSGHYLTVSILLH